MESDQRAVPSRGRGTARYRYRAFGLRIDSDLALPELASGTGPADVVVRLDAPMAVPDEGPWFRMEDGAFRMRIRDVGQFRIARGREIVIQPDPAATGPALRLFTLGSAFGALLHQRGVLALHGSTVSRDGSCITIVGASGAGKSTTAAELVRRGFGLLTDDVSAVRVVGGAAEVFPAYPQHKLWDDAMRTLDLDAAAFPRVLPSEDKRAVAVAGGFSADPVRLGHVVVLETHAEPDVAAQSIRGADRVSALIEHTYRPFFLPEMGLIEAHFKVVSAVAKAAPVTRVRRPETGASLARVVEAVLDAAFREHGPSRNVHEPAHRGRASGARRNPNDSASK